MSSSVDPPAAKGNPKKKMRKSKLARYRCVGRWAAYCSAPPLAGEGGCCCCWGGKGVQDRDTQEREDRREHGGAGQGYSFLLLVFVVVIAVVVAVVIVFLGGC